MQLMRKILSILGKEPKANMKMICESANTNYRTAKSKLEQIKEILGLRVVSVVDVSKVKDLTVAIIGICLNCRDLEKKLEEISLISGVDWACSVSGNYDIIAQITSVNGMDGVNDFFNHEFQKVDNVLKSDTMMVLSSKNKLIKLNSIICENVRLVK